MPRTRQIYVSDKLSKRMKAVKESINWSRIAQQAFEQELAKMTHIPNCCSQCHQTDGYRILVEVYVDAKDISDNEDSPAKAVALELKHAEMEDQFGTGRNWPKPKWVPEGFCTKCQLPTYPTHTPLRSNTNS